MSQIHQLYKLQQIDSEIDEKKQRLGTVLKLQKGNPAVMKAQARVETAVSNYQAIQTQQKDKNLELSSLNDKRKASEKRLYSGTVTNTKELTDLQEEVESLGRRAESLEEEMLAIMAQAEEAEQEKNESESALGTLEAAWAEESVGLKDEQNTLALRLHHLIENRKAHVTTVPPDALKLYEHMRPKKGGVAVSKVRVTKCLSCQITNSDQAVKNAKSGNIVNCGGCGRIMYVV